ncbi:hypothetical protein IMY05_C3085000200 [Salix suchowensis]|nr:hypothetical protein IMY05_C3085000200 [Salix suchowensis]
MGLGGSKIHEIPRFRPGLDGLGGYMAHLGTQAGVRGGNRSGTLLEEEVIVAHDLEQKMKLTMQFRPPQVADWMQRHRPYTEAAATITDVDEFGDATMKWWRQIQPLWRQGDDKLPLAIYTPPENKSWDVLAQGGPTVYYCLWLFLGGGARSQTLHRRSGVMSYLMLRSPSRANKRRKKNSTDEGTGKEPTGPSLLLTIHRNTVTTSTPRVHLIDNRTTTARGTYLLVLKGNNLNPHEIHPLIPWMTIRINEEDLVEEDLEETEEDLGEMVESRRWAWRPGGGNGDSDEVQGK